MIFNALMSFKLTFGAMGRRFNPCSPYKKEHQEIGALFLSYYLKTNQPT